MMLHGQFSRFLAVGVAACAISGTALGQVFTQNPDAVTGPATFGSGDALYGDFGLNSASDPEFKIYRKYLEQDEPFPLSSATNVDGNLGEASWIDVNQRQGVAEGPKYVLTAPGMFIGQKNHVNDDGWVTSNPDEILYFKPLSNVAENGPAADTEDSNAYANWDTRFGFMEDPDAYLDLISPNSNNLDLWTGELATDAVQLQLLIDNDDSKSEQVLTQVNASGSFKLNAADDQFDDERGRVNQPMTRSVAGSGDASVDTYSDSGTAYGDPIEITWGMRQADPENPALADFSDDAAARAVEYFLKAGNLISSGVFDPGEEGISANDAPWPNEDNDGGPYSDNFFDWQSAKPVFFAGAEGGAEGEGSIGIFIPGDFGADGSVGVEDFTRLAGDYGNSGTTYSRGDITQDGITDLADATAWAAVADAATKAAAVSAVGDDVTAGGSLYDFDGSGATDAADMTFVSELLGGGVVGECNPGTMGDIDGSGDVAFADFLILSQNFGQTAADHTTGDIDCSGDVALADFLILSQNFGQVVGGAQSVPEPNGAVLLALAAMSLGLVRRRR